MLNDPRVTVFHPSFSNLRYVSNTTRSGPELIVQMLKTLLKPAVKLPIRYVDILSFNVT